jgi:hypothetical protein
MRHGRKSRSQRFDGYKRHVLKDLDIGVVRAVGITPANVPESAVTKAIADDLEPSGGDKRPIRLALSGLELLTPVDKMSAYCE